MGNKGFSLLELVFALVLLTALVAVIPPGAPVSRQNLDAAARKVLSDLFYARQLAMMTGINHGASFTAGGSYVVYEGNPAAPIKDPLSGGDFSEDLGRFVNVFVSSSLQVEFNSMGWPVLGGGTSVPLSNGSETQSIQITATTGLLEIP